MKKTLTSFFMEPMKTQLGTLEMHEKSLQFTKHQKQNKKESLLLLGVLYNFELFDEMRGGFKTLKSSK